MEYVLTSEKGKSINAHTYGDPNSGTGGVSGNDPARPASPRSGPDGSPAAARLLEMTARETDQWRSEAKSEAAAIVASAREEAAKLVRAAREEAGRLAASAQDEAAKTVNDARVEAYRVREETTAIRKRHDEDIAHLQHLATEHREQLRHHLTHMLDRVDASPGDSNP
jgi:cell division septum initiation protein DivIVA